MSLSLNWKKLSSKLDKSKVTKPVQKKVYRKRHTTKHAPIKAEELPQSQPHTTSKVVSPLEKALWETEIGAKLVIDPNGPPQPIDFNNPNKTAAGKYLAMDCEFVGVGHNRSALARVSLVNLYGVVLLDTFVKPKEKVTDWRTWVSGVAPRHMHQAILFEEAQKKVCQLLKGKVLVGHAVQNDLKSLLISHPRNMIRDTSRFSVFRQMAKGKPPSLKRLAKELLGLDIQTLAHSSVEDAQVTMAVFRTHMRAIDSEQKGKS